MKLSFNAEIAGKTTEYDIMFKTGDDVRQDQLVLQMIVLLDTLLR